MTPARNGELSGSRLGLSGEAAGHVAIGASAGVLAPRLSTYRLNMQNAARTSIRPKSTGVELQL